MRVLFGHFKKGDWIRLRDVATFVRNDKAFGCPVVIMMFDFYSSRRMPRYNTEAQEGNPQNPHTCK